MRLLLCLIWRAFRDVIASTLELEAMPTIFNYTFFLSRNLFGFCFNETTRNILQRNFRLETISEIDEIQPMKEIL